MKEFSSVPGCRVCCVPSEKKALYDFIVRHFLASCSKDAVGQETNVTIDIAGEAFRTTGMRQVQQRNLIAVLLCMKLASTRQVCWHLCCCDGRQHISCL